MFSHSKSLKRDAIAQIIYKDSAILVVNLIGLSSANWFKIVMLKVYFRCFPQSQQPILAITFA
jgi:hypothetical protein